MIFEEKPVAAVFDDCRVVNGTRFQVRTGKCKPEPGPSPNLI